MKLSKTLLTAIVEKTGTGFSAYIKEMDGVIAVGDSLAELKNSLNESLFHHLDYLNETEGSELSTDDYTIDYHIDLQQFFDYFKVINKSAFAESYLHINKSLFRQYTKGITSLSDKKLKKISTGLHQLAHELDDISLIS
ncbi:hypothetical protein E7Z59_08220 [Robertkochia marina]|uniref:Type II toxin-antitoxin system HicB family antitoxin n=1 Tax=Robertkochia marina TaxID=1227945 RepID=A0A4S3LZU7_9FLAO|nr:hypothetical protein [Robertkochia marina]THD67634.1 hypothetical protein E7Z59_08220 [Robertkochia marina]TRZ43367.1 hypothetical protein D3A96_10360 [Robertkochia marina]